MKKFLLPALLTGFTLAGVPSAMASQPVMPTVTEGSFHCFRGLDIEPVAAPAQKLNKVKRLPKLGNSKWDNTDGHDLREIPVEGSPRILVILVNYQDTKFKTSVDPQALVSEMLNGENYTFQGATSSAKKFYEFVSAGQFSPQFDVVGPVELSKISKEYVTPSEPEYYVGADGKQTQVYPATRMVEEAVKAVDGQVNFADYDCNNDGMVDFVYVFYAGRGATTGGNQNTTIWPHAFTFTSGIGAPIEVDGKLMDRYACSAEIGTGGVFSGIGTFCHEFGHVLGLPDLYDTKSQQAGSTSKCFTPGTFDTMDGGNYNNTERTPACFSMYEQYSLEWTRPVEITGGADVTLLPLSARPFGYKVNTTRPQEYFMLEARGPVHNDKYLEGHGLLVWHIDFNLDIWNNNGPNNEATHQRIDIVEADDMKDRGTRAGDVFPGSTGVHDFNADVNPAFVDWRDNSTGYSLSKINRWIDGSVNLSIVSENGKEMEGMKLNAPKPLATGATPNSISVKWDAVEGATGYMVSAFDLAKFDGRLITEYVDGFTFKDVKNNLNAEINGLEPGHRYGVIVYALSEKNASHAELLEVATSGADFSAPSYLYLTADADIVTFKWDNVADADRYELTVGLPAEAETSSTVTVDFEGSQIPLGWNSDAKYEERDRHCGKAAPALKFTINEQNLTSPVFEKQIKRISFMAKAQYDDPNSLTIYGMDADGNLRLVEELADFKSEKQTYTVDFPENIYGVKILFRSYATGLAFYLDDLDVEFHDGYSVVPVDATIDYSGNSAKVQGLDPNTLYGAYLTAYKGSETGKRGEMITFRPSSAPSKVEGIGADSDASFSISGGVLTSSDAEVPFSVYSIDGTLLASGVRGAYTLPMRGVYIVRSAEKAAKLCW